MRSSIWQLPLFIILTLPLQIGIWGGELLLQEGTPQVTILSPLPGQAVQGILSVIVNAELAGFQSAELSFAYANNPTGTWFVIHQTVEPFADGALVDWDTSTITDGNYDLRLVVTLQDQTRVEAVVRGIRVRNYSPVETDTPTPVLPSSTPLPGEIPPPSAKPSPTVTPSPTITRTPTPLPTNQAELSPRALLSSLGMGFLVVAGVFVFLGLYLTMRNWLRRRET